MGKPSIWTTGYFDVPVTYNEEQVQWIAPKYMKRFGIYLENQGFAVVNMCRPVPSGEIHNELFGQPDSKRYTIFAEVTRQPQVLHMEIPDHAVTEMEKVGLTLNE